MSSTEMKSYLSLIPISAKVRRRQNRMTILCIVLAVFLVTAVFSMADMAIRMETSNQLNKNGNWHIMVKDISPETAAELAAQEDVAAFSAYSDINASLTENYFAGDKRAALVGADDAILQIFPGMQCSTAPADGEVLVTANIRDWLDVTVGTAIPLTLPDGQTISLTVAGFNEDTSDANQYDAVVLVMNRSTFSQIAAQGEESFETQYFIQFKPRTNLRQSIVNIENKYGISEEKISENTYLMALNASSNNDYIVGLYAVAAVLAGMVVLAGIFMITGSINSNVAQRTSYYGMLRCLGAGKNQVRMLVRLEALFWCKTAVPAGCVLGIVSTWGLCSFLRGFIGEEFSSLPVLGISPVGILCGSVLGLITVWFAASSPARRAAKASPITAATGNAVENATVSPCHARLFGSRAELSLGVSHATSSKKNLLLMTGSFALSILLFLSFSVLLRWVGFALNPLQPYTPDLSVAETSGQNVLDPVLVEQLEIFKSFGVDLSRVVLSHIDLSADLDYMKRLLDQGVNIAFDTIGKCNYQPDVSRADWLSRLCAEGYDTQIVMSMDITRRSNFADRGGVGYSYLLDTFAPLASEAGVPDRAWENLLYRNALRIYKGQK